MIKIFILLFLITFSQAMGQSRTDYDLLLEKYKNEKTVVLNSHQTITISETDTGLRIVEKVYLEKMLVGKNKDDISNGYISFSNFSKISDFEAYTLSPKGASWERFNAYNFSDVTHVGSFFYNDNFFRIVTFPKIEQGCRTVLSYTKTYTEPYLWGAHILSHGEAVDTGFVKVIAPRGMSFSVFAHNISKDQLTYTLSKKGRKNISSWEYSIQKSVESDAVPAFYTTPILLINISEFAKRDTTITYLKDNSHLAKWYYGNFLKAGNRQDSILENMTDSLTAGINDAYGISQAVFNWVRRNIKYVGVEDGYNGIIPRNSSYVLKQRYGDCKDKSNLMIEMLRHKNITAFPAFTGTTDLPFDHDSIPNPIVDNHVIVAVDTGGKQLCFFDPTQTTYVPGLPPMALQGKSAMVVTDSMDYIVHHFPMPSPDQNILSQSSKLTILDGQLSLLTKVNANGYFYMYFKALLSEQSTKKCLTSCTSVAFSDSRIYVSDSLTNLVLNEDSATASYDLYSHLATPLTTSKSGIFLNPYPSNFYLIDEIRVIEEMKQYSFPFPARWEFSTSFDLAEGYLVQSLPENITIDSAAYSFNLKHTITNGQLIIEGALSVDKLYIMNDEMPGFISFMTSIKKAFSQSILITTKS